MPFRIYYLRCPRTDAIKYVGLSSRPEYRRRAEHTLNAPRRIGPKLTAWLESIEPDRPIIETQCILEFREEGLRVESALIDLLRARGEDLVNGLEEERREKISRTISERNTPEFNAENGKRVKASLALLPPERRCGAAVTTEGKEAKVALYKDPLWRKLRRIINPNTPFTLK